MNGKDIATLCLTGIMPVKAPSEEQQKAMPSTDVRLIAGGLTVKFADPTPEEKAKAEKENKWYNKAIRYGVKGAVIGGVAAAVVLLTPTVKKLGDKIADKIVK